MASALAGAHIEAHARLRRATVSAVERIWRSLPTYNRPDLERWLQAVVPLVTTAQRTSVKLTDAYLARALDRPPLGLPAEDLIASVRGDTTPESVYERPFVTIWSALSAGTRYEDAVNAGLARATASAAMDVQMAMRSTAQAVQDADENVYGFSRAADPGACAFCAEIDGAYVMSADAFPLHPNCGCGLEPLTSPHRLAARLPSGVAVHQHGELGPLIGSPDHEFTGPSDL